MLMAEAEMSHKQAQVAEAAFVTHLMIRAGLLEELELGIGHSFIPANQISEASQMN